MKPSELPYVKIEPSEIGEHTYISEYSHISQFTKIGKFCSVANLCTIGAQQHDTHNLSNFILRVSTKPKSTLVGNDVWIGCNSVVLAGVTVGDGAVIGAGAVVTHDVPPYAIVIGNPARVVRYRFEPEVVAELLSLRWWDLPIESLRNLPIFDIKASISALRDLTSKDTLTNILP